MSDQLDRQFAKKVFFLFPHSVIQDQLLTVLVQAEYEVATLASVEKARKLLYTFPSSILFVNIEAEFKEEIWESFIRDLLGSSKQHDARIGILTYNPNPDLAKKYLMDVGIQCGFITLKLGLTESIKIILKTLDANEAKGGRRFVRVKCPEGKSSLSVNVMGRMVQGSVLDISSAGMACKLEEEVKKGDALDDIQMVLWGSILKAGGSVMGVRTDDNGGKVYVIMFSDPMPKDSRSKLYQFIRKAVQSEIDQVQ